MEQEELHPGTAQYEVKVEAVCQTEGIVSQAATLEDGMDSLEAEPTVTGLAQLLFDQ